MSLKRFTGTKCAWTRNLLSLANKNDSTMRDVLKSLNTLESEGKANREAYDGLLRRLQRHTTWTIHEEEDLLKRIMTGCNKNRIKCTPTMLHGIYNFYGRIGELSEVLNKLRLPDLLKVDSFAKLELTPHIAVAKLRAYSKYPKLKREFISSLPEHIRHNSEMIAAYIKSAESPDEVLEIFHNFRNVSPKTIFSNVVLTAMIKRLADLGDYRTQSDILVIFTVNSAAAQSSWQLFFDECHSQHKEVIVGMKRMISHGVEPSFDNLIALGRAHALLCERKDDHHYTSALQTIKKLVAFSSSRPPQKIVALAENLFLKTKQSKEDLVSFMESNSHEQWMVNWSAHLLGKL